MTTACRPDALSRRSDPSAAIIALGANIEGCMGTPAEALDSVVAALEAELNVSRASRIYKSTPVGGGRQPDYLNAVVVVRFSGGSSRLLNLLKRLERAAGRRPGRRWGPRPLDLDIIDHGGRRIGSPGARRRPPLVLPHPQAHLRAFVLVPIAEVAPKWRHPLMGTTARALLRRLRPGDRKQVREWGAFCSTIHPPA